MSRDNVMKFRNVVNSDPNLQDVIRGAIRNEPDFNVVRFAADRGFDFSNQDLRDVFRNVGDELSDFELEIVAGGREVIYTGEARMRAAIDFAPAPYEDPSEDSEGDC